MVGKVLYIQLCIETQYVKFIDLGNGDSNSPLPTNNKNQTTMELMTEEWHNKFGVFKDGFGQFEYILPNNRNFDIKVIFSHDYIMLRQKASGGALQDDLISIWNRDLTRRNIYVHEWRILYKILAGEALTITQTI